MINIDLTNFNHRLMISCYFVYNSIDYMFIWKNATYYVDATYNFDIIYIDVRIFSSIFIFTIYRWRDQRYKSPTTTMLW